MVRGHTVQSVLVERALDIDAETYLSVNLDRRAGRLSIMASAEGGVDIEEIAHERPDAVFLALVEPCIGLMDFQVRQLAAKAMIPGPLASRFGDTVAALLRAASLHDATLLEINPLAVCDGRLIALDAKAVVDDNALYRQQRVAQWREEVADDGPVTQARRAGLSYVRLGGEIGCIVNGAGLAMATMDVIDSLGGRPANFLDVGGGARAAQIESALHLLLADEAVRAILINIFGGITRCDEVAQGVVKAMRALPRGLPLLVRLVGTNDEAGRQMLLDADVGARVAASLEEAAELAIRAAGGSHEEPTGAEGPL
jgi:succinyl-CoA synthetase beta subunit